MGLEYRWCIGTLDPTQGPPSIDPMLRAYLWDAILLILAIAAPLLSAWISCRYGEVHWFQRSGSLTVLFAAILEFRQAIIVEKVRNETWAAAKRRSYAGTAIVGQLPSPRIGIAIIALFLIIFGTIIWGYGDLLFPIVFVR